MPRGPGNPADVIDLAGAWQFRLDPEHVGEKQQWYAAR